MKFSWFDRWLYRRILRLINLEQYRREVSLEKWFDEAVSQSKFPPRHLPPGEGK